MELFTVFVIGPNNIEAKQLGSSACIMLKEVEERKTTALIVCRNSAVAQSYDQKTEQVHES